MMEKMEVFMSEKLKAIRRNKKFQNVMWQLQPRTPNTGSIFGLVMVELVED